MEGFGHIGGRFHYGLLKIFDGTGRADASQIWPENAAFAANAMASGTTAAGVNLFAKLRIARNGFLASGVLGEAVEVFDDLGRFFIGEIERRHGCARYAQTDDALDGDVGIAMAERRGDEVGSASTSGSHTMAESTVAAEEGAALLEAGLGAQGRWDEDYEEPFHCGDYYSSLCGNYAPPKRL